MNDLSSLRPLRFWQVYVFFRAETTPGVWNDPTTDYETAIDSYEEAQCSYPDCPVRILAIDLTKGSATDHTMSARDHLRALLRQRGIPLPEWMIEEDAE